MAIWLNKGEKDGTQAGGGCDGVSDVANLETFAQEHHLKVGSNFLCIDTSDVYMMKSDGTFKKL